MPQYTILRRTVWVFETKGTAFYEIMFNVYLFFNEFLLQIPLI